MGKFKLTSVNANAETKELFESTCKYEYNKLLKKEELIFEGLNYNLDTSKLFEEFFQDKEDGYMALLDEATHERKAYVKDYFYNKTVIPIYEGYQNFIDLKKIKCLEEDTEFFQSFSDKVKLESTAKYLLENIVLDFLPMKNRKEISQSLMESKQLQFHELEETFNNAKIALEESYDSFGTKDENILSKTAGLIQDGIDQVVGTVTGTARLLKEMVLGLIVLLYSPFMIVSSENLKYRVLGSSGKGKIKQFMELIGPCQNIGELLLGSYSEVGSILKKVNEVDSPDVKAFIKEVTQHSNVREKIINDCWLKNAKVPSATEQGKTGLVNFVHTLGNYIQTGRMTVIGNPQDAGSGMLGFLFAMDSDNPNFQRSFFEFRKCTYDHIFTLIIGYAKTAVEVQISTIDILERIKVASKRKDYSIFNTIQSSPEDAENLMYKVGKVLLNIDELAESLKKNKQLLFQDQFIDQFYVYLKQKIKQAYLDLDEISSKASTKDKERKYTDGEHPDDKYEESWKDHSLSTIRHGKKPTKIKSIYDN